MTMTINTAEVEEVSLGPEEQKTADGNKIASAGSENNKDDGNNRWLRDSVRRWFEDGCPPQSQRNGR